MLIDLEAAQGEWFFWFGSHIDPVTGEPVYEEPAEGARVKVRPIAPFIEERLAGRKREIQNVLNSKTRAMERISYYPDLPADQARAERDDLIDFTIVDFEGFKDSRTGEVIACTRENKLKLAALPIFDRFLGRCWQLLADSAGLAKENEEKN